MSATASSFVKMSGNEKILCDLECLDRLTIMRLVDKIDYVFQLR